MCCPDCDQNLYKLISGTPEQNRNSRTEPDEIAVQTNQYKGHT
jgi:hypothetical protein